MSDSGYRNKPKKLRGALLEFGLNLPPLIVPFQFNPDQLKRSRSLNFQGEEPLPPPPAPMGGSAQSGASVAGGYQTHDTLSLRELHEQKSDLLEIRSAQHVTVGEESIDFELHLDAADELNDGDPIAGLAGILPRLATLELMVTPKSESILGAALESVVGDLLGNASFSFTGGDKPPLVLFVWGPSRILPVNINSMSVTENEFNTWLSPVRAKVSINMTVIEGRNDLYSYSTAAREVLSLLNLANIAEVAEVVVPG